MKKFIIILVSILFCVTSLSYAQNINWNLTGAGARAAGFGGAFIGVADDATAISWNPAGLTQLIDPEFSAVMRYINDSYDFVRMGSGNTLGIGHVVPNFMSAVYPFNFGSRSIVAGVAYQQMLDFYSEGEDYYGDDYKTTGGVYTMSLGLGAQIIPVFSVGVTSNVWTGTYKYEEISKDDDAEHFSGFNFNLGAMINLENLNSPLPVKFGFGFKSPFDLNSDFDYTVEMPTMLGFGGSVRLGDNLTVACDYETRAYGSSKIVYDGGGETSLSDYDLNQLRVGAEYLLVTDFAVIPVRAGFHTLPTIYSNFDDYGDVVDQVVGSGFAFGTGLIFEKIAIDATVTMDSFKQRTAETEGNYTKLSTTTFTLSGILYLN
jgi:hypothetical protein